MLTEAGDENTGKPSSDTAESLCRLAELSWVVAIYTVAMRVTSLILDTYIILHHLHPYPHIIWIHMAHMTYGKKLDEISAVRQEVTSRVSNIWNAFKPSLASCSPWDADNKEMRPHGERSSVDLMSFRGRHHWWRHELYKSSKYLINSDMCGKQMKLMGDDGFHNMVSSSNSCWRWNDGTGENGLMMFGAPTSSFLGSSGVGAPQKSPVLETLSVWNFWIWI